MSGHRDLLLVFGTVQRVMRAERLARKQGLDVDVIPAPRAVSSECGMVLEARSSQASALVPILEAAGLETVSTWRLDSGSWLPTSLDAPPGPPKVSLTKGSSYGGCGAKLSKGLLSSILCGLPRIESEDLLVGIEAADDAGVVRVAPDLGIIHTADFFPPLVDDPYSFGRIAAANALSDVYAMGGEPLAGMNLLSFPLESLGKATLKEILRGGLSALAEAGAVLAGGHTLEGNELLYGMAVTGRVHPDRIWRNAGARPGDKLVLTKPLGTGLITTAAKAELTDPGHLAMAIRWMSTLNQRAAEAARGLEVHAGTDVTGFALVGHAAELAEASGVALRISLAAMPLLPGARDAAEMGLVPVGTTKNRQSLQAVLDLAAGVDPILVDIALDPQTSGGLLLALPPDQAQQLVRSLPASAIIGDVLEAPAGRVLLEP
jgi:selenide,water dikinase